MITIHMLLALIIVAFLIFGYFYSTRYKSFAILNNIKLFRLTLLIVILYLLQVVFGTQVRESIDSIAFNMMHSQREIWIDYLGLTFYIHRSYSILIFALNSYLVYLIYSDNSLRNTLVMVIGKFLILLLLIEIGSGVVMAYFAIPAFLQPIHLTVATIIFGLQVYLLLLFSNKKLSRLVDSKSKTSI
jgi:cytochrome c oxidase assembly protein subunit 15